MESDCLLHADVCEANRKLVSMQLSVNPFYECARDSPKIERFSVPIEIERESEKRMDGHSPICRMCRYIYYRQSDTSGWRRPRIKARRLYGHPTQTSLRLARRAFTVCDCHGSVLWETPNFLHRITNKRLLLVRWFERFWGIVQKLLDSFGVGC
jgi:hypothetical protein